MASLAGVHREFSAPALAQLCGVSLRTARRWKQRGAVPDRAARLAAVTVDLGTIDAAWAGWQLSSGGLYSPDGWRFLPGEIQALPTLYPLLREMRRGSTIPLFPPGDG